MNRIFALMAREFRLELRRKSVISGIVLYLFSLVFICYLSFSLRQEQINAATWSALFWLVILFASVNSVAKGFMGEKPGAFIYMFWMASPESVIVSKILYNALVCLALALFGYGLFATFLYDPVQDKGVFLAGIILVSFGFAASMSLISGIAAKAKNSHVLMSVLSFPVLLAILVLAIKLTRNAVDGLDPSVSSDELSNLVAINLISFSLAYLLFPYIWRS